ncbi:MAG: aspartate-semialdehyde dehydrogenase [Vulcanimicrobiaceae bacterium]
MRLAIVGVTGVVGETIMRVLDERVVPIDEFGAFASRDRDVPLRYRDRDWPIRAATPEALARGYDVVFFASSDDASADLAEACARSGAIVIDNSATFRLAEGVPLVVPEVNPGDARPECRIYPVANCTAIVLCVGIAPIARVAGLRSVRVASYQSVSGAGRAGLEALEREELAQARGETATAPSPFAAPISRNVIPLVGSSIDADGDTGEEKKLVAETRKMLGLPDLHVAATTVRVPVRFAHSEAVFIETERDTSANELGAALAHAPGVVFHATGIVTPRDVEGQDLVHVARLRAEGESKRHFQLWIVGDQTRKGAATNAVQILELLVARGYVGASAARA